MSSVVQAIQMSDSAAMKVKSLIEEEEQPELMLRVFITGGGCSGFQYGFTFDEQISEDDTVVEKSVAASGDKDKASGGEEGGSSAQVTVVKLLVDPMSYQYLIGAEIDYKDDLEGARFIIRNPNAKTTCGCGSSFSVADDDE